MLACIPVRYAAWNNGRLARPNVKLQSIRRIVRDKEHNPNEAYVREVECTGYPGKYALTGDQRETVAYLIARDSIRAQSPTVTSRVAALGAFDTAWAAVQTEVRSTFDTWTTSLANTQLQQLAEDAVDRSLTLLDGLDVEPCFRALWANARASLELRAESYIAVMAANATDTVEVWQSVEAAVTFLTGAQRLQWLVTTARAGVDCVTA